MKEPMVITMAREYASGGSEIAQAVADKLGVPLYNKELITLAAKKSGLTEEAIAAAFFVGVNVLPPTANPRGSTPKSRTVWKELKTSGLV